MNLLDVVDLHARHLGTKRALSDDMGNATYAELAEAVAGTAGSLQAQGVHPGDVVAVMCDPSIPAVVAILAVQKLGAVAAPVNLRLSASEISAYVQRIDAALVIADRALGDQTPAVITLAGAVAPGTIRERMGMPYRAPIAVATPEGAAAMAFPTGGTTGLPKAALWSGRGLRDIVVSNSVNLEVRRSDVELYISSLAHLTIVTGLFPTLYMGATTHLMSRFDAAAAAGLFETLAPSRMFATPTALSRMLEQLGDKTQRGRDIRITYGAARNTADLRRRTLEVLPQARLITGYGATEFGPVTRLYPEDPEADLAGVLGHPVPGASVRVVGSDGAEIRPGETGELLVRSPWQMIGYMGDEDPFTVDGFIRSGDLGWVNDNGCFFLNGRSKDLIKTGGENVYPNEVEDVIQSHAAVADAGVYGMDDDVWGERVEAAVVLRSPLDAARLREYCSERLAGFKVPKHFRFVDALPLTANMKLDRRRLRQDAR